MLNSEAFKNRMLEQAIERLRHKLLPPTAHTDSTARLRLKSVECDGVHSFNGSPATPFANRHVGQDKNRHDAQKTTAPE